MNKSLQDSIAAFDSEERKLLLYKLRSLAAEDDSNTGDKPKRLVAYVKPAQDLQMDSLQAFLKERLPAYMIPSTILAIDEIPQLPNGKIDKVALSKMKHKADDKDVDQPQESSEIEKKLIAIWEQVLDFSPILPNDNFFEIGGDSILSIQIVAKARNAGITLSPNQLFENQTIAELALFAKNEEQEAKTEKVEGELELTPVQHWFFELHKAAPHYWNQIMEVRNTAINKPPILEEIVGEIIGHHDALRLSFKKSGDSWNAFVLNKEEVHYFFHIDLEQITDQEEQNKEIRKQLYSIQSGCELSKGGLFKCVFFKGNPLLGNRIFLVGHHLVTDMVTWNILQSDLIQLIQQYNQNEKYALERKIATIKEWADQLYTLSASTDIGDEKLYWQSQVCRQDLLPADFESGQSVYEENSIEIFKWVLNEDDTSFLVQGANELYNTRTEDLLISALAATICSWAGVEEFAFLMEKHGRTADVLTVDVSNTVGWFTSIFPVKMNYKPEEDLGEQIKYVKEQLRKIPNNGIGFGVLKYLSGEKQMPQYPPLVFNYLGNQKNTKLTDELTLIPIPEGARHPSSERNYSLEINAFISEGKLNINWSFTNKKFKVATIEQLTLEFEANIKSIIAYCKNKDSGEYTPSDFPEANISQEDLDNLLKGM